VSCNAKILSSLKIRYLAGLVKAKSYILYTEPYQLNIVGVRNKNTNPIRFDDKLNVFWKDGSGKWEGRQYAITTDPSTVYLERGGFVTAGTGTAILPNGQYVDAWKIGTHRGYKALVQAKDICVYRDYDRNAFLDFNIEDKTCGLYGINIHRAISGGANDGEGNTSEIGDYSAGCQVFQNYYCFQDFLGLVEKQEGIYGNKYFTYTLFDKWLQNKFYVKRATYGFLIFVGLAFLGYGLYLMKKTK